MRYDRLRRREFISLLGGAATTWPLAARAQPSARPKLIGFLLTGSLNSKEGRANPDAFREGLRVLGYSEGHDVVIEYREAQGNIERFTKLARELTDLKVDVIVASNTPAALASRQATSTISIVVPVMGDPVQDRLVASLARPGGNVTGLTFLGPELVPKRLAQLKSMLPGMSRIATLWHPGAYGEHTLNSMFNEATNAAGTLGLHLQAVQIRSPDELAPAFATINAEAVFPFPSPMFYTERKQIADLSIKHRLPSIFVDRAFVEVGGLMGYGTSIAELFRAAAKYVDKILRGANPAELPVEQASKFELSINLRTAKILDLEIPPTVLALADFVVE